MPKKAHKDDSPDKLAELTADLQRVQAEFVNFKRRIEDERADLVDFAKGRIVREFLTVRDSFDNELAHRPADVDLKWAASIDAIRAQFDQVLKAVGAERFESVGYAFDPKLHEAIAMDDGDGEHEIVTAELQPGYRLGGNVLRHAMVRVGKGNGPKADPPPDAPDKHSDEESIDKNQEEQ